MKTQDHRYFLNCISTSLMLFLLCALLTPLHADAAGDKPNVVLLYIDDLGYGDTGPYGCKDIPTPNIDRLAQEGVTCTAAYVTNPPCCPSRCSMIMGQYAQRFGKYGMSRGLPIPDDKPNLAEFMRDNGYVTGFVGKWDLGTLGQSPMNEGFMEVAKTAPKLGKSQYICVMEDGSHAYETEVVGDYMVEFVERNKDQPFFFYFSPFSVHSKNRDTPVELQDRTTAKGKRRLLAGNIVSVDDQVGKLLETLEKHDLRDNTLIVFASDNGPNLTEQGTAAPYTGGKGPGTQQEGWARVPVIFSYPGHVPEGKKYDGLMATFDFYSTFASAIGQAIPEHCDGVDLFPIFREGKNTSAHEYLFWWNKDPTDPPHRHLVAVRWKHWRMLKHKKKGWQLFNLQKDPEEKNDVKEKHPDIAERLIQQHAEWAEELPPIADTGSLERPKRVPQGFGWLMAKPE